MRPRGHTADAKAVSRANEPVGITSMSCSGLFPNAWQSPCRTASPLGPTPNLSASSRFLSTPGASVFSVSLTEDLLRAAICTPHFNSQAAMIGEHPNPTGTVSGGTSAPGPCGRRTPISTHHMQHTHAIDAVAFAICSVYPLMRTFVRIRPSADWFSTFSTRPARPPKHP